MRVPLEIHADQIEVLREIHGFRLECSKLRGAIPVHLASKIDGHLNSINDLCEEIETEWKRWIMDSLADRLNDPDLLNITGVRRVAPWRVYVHENAGCDQ